jgi:rhomboid family GlyGly-CTERM serine protease
MIALSSPRVASLLLTLFVGLNLVTLFMGWDAYLQYQRYAIGHGEVWRVITGHLVHISAMHFLLNLFGLLIIWQLASDWMGNADSLKILLISMLLISLGLYFFYPQVQWYRGLSGALHAFWSAAAFLGLERRRPLAILLLALLLIKLAWEVTIGPVPMSRELSGGDILIQSHWLGAISGLLIAAGFMILKLFKVKHVI